MADEIRTETIWIVNPGGALHTAEADVRVLKLAEKKREAVTEADACKAIGAVNDQGIPDPKRIPGRLWGNPGALSALLRTGGWRVATDDEIEAWAAARIPDVLSTLRENARRARSPQPTAADEAAAIADYYEHQGLKPPSRAEIKAAKEPPAPPAPAPEPVKEPAPSPEPAPKAPKEK